jgi:hypothetical protein
MGVSKMVRGDFVGGLDAGQECQLVILRLALFLLWSQITIILAGATFASFISCSCALEPSRHNVEFVHQFVNGL